jgi:hypothetical protein
MMVRYIFNHEKAMAADNWLNQYLARQEQLLAEYLDLHTGLPDWF